MNIEKKSIYRILVFSSVIIAVIISITFYVSSNKKNENLGCGNKSPESICGTESNSPLEKQAGKSIFNSNCAACHKLDAKATGPALRAIDSVNYWKMMTQISVKIDTTKTNQFGLEYHQSYFQNLTKEDLENLYFYIQ